MKEKQKKFNALWRKRKTPLISALSEEKKKKQRKRKKRRNKEKEKNKRTKNLWSPPSQKKMKASHRRHLREGGSISNLLSLFSFHCFFLCADFFTVLSSCSLTLALLLFLKPWLLCSSSTILIQLIWNHELNMEILLPHTALPKM